MPRVIFCQLAFLMAFSIASMCFACFQFLSGSEGLTSVRMRAKKIARPSDPSLLKKGEDEYFKRRQLALGAFLAKAVPSNWSQESHVGTAAGKHNVRWNRTHVGHNEVAGYSGRPKSNARTEKRMKLSTKDTDSKIKVGAHRKIDGQHIPPRGAGDTKVNKTSASGQKTEYSSFLEDPEISSGRHPRNCTPGRSVAMIKTHKCSSSTLQNILLRKAEDLNLTIAVPRENTYFYSPNFFRRSFIRGDRRETRYNIMASHMRFNRLEAVREVMVPDAKFITILREPSRQFESLYSYYGWMYIFKVNLKNFLEDPERYFSLYGPQRTLVAGRNPMCYDNGLDARHLMTSDPRVEAFIASMGKWHDLVLIAEHFEESLVLLKELMCWTLDDVVFLSQNMRSKKVIDDLSPENQTAIRKWNWADTLLYEHFNATLWSKIDAFGISRMKEEVAELRRRNKALAEDCIGKVVETGDKRMWYPPGIRIKSFLLRRSAKNKHLCEQLTRPEMTYLDVFRERIPEEILTRNRTFMNNTTFSVSRKKDALVKYLAKTLNKPTNRKLKYSRDMDRILAELGPRADTTVVEKWLKFNSNGNRSGKRQGPAMGTGNTSDEKNNMTS